MPQGLDIDLMELDPFVAGEDGELFRRLRDEDPCHWNDEEDGPGFWSLTRYEDVKAAGSDWQTFSSAQGTQIQSRRAEGHGKPSIHNMDPPRHKPLRCAWPRPSCTRAPASSTCSASASARSTSSSCAPASVSPPPRSPSASRATSW